MDCAGGAGVGVEVDGNLDQSNGDLTKSSIGDSVTLQITSSGMTCTCRENASSRQSWADSQLQQP